MPLFVKIWVCGGLVGDVFVVCVCVVCGHIHIPTHTPQTYTHLGVECIVLILESLFSSNYTVIQI